MKVSAKEIAQYVDGSIEGDASVEIWGFGKIEEAKKGEISFLANLKYAQYLYSTEASAILVSKDFQPEHEVQTTLIRVDDPYSALAILLQLSEQMQEKEQGVSEQAYIHPSVKIPDGVYVAPGAFLSEGVKLGKGARIYPHVYVGKGVSIGDESVLYPSVCVYHKTQIGKRCIIHAGAVIGADGFGFAPQADGYHKIPQMGNVILEDDVEVGANTCIDRAVMGSTIIEKGVKLDNLVQIGHNVVVSKNTVIAAQAGIAGSTKVGEWNMLGGQSGLAGHIKTAAHVTVAAQTGIISDLKKENETYFGSPAFPIKTAMRGYSILPKLPEIYRTMGRLEQQVAELQNKLDLLGEKNK